MNETPSTKFDRESSELLLGVLSVVERNSSVTQRGMSNQLGIALGLANAVLKRCVRKGLIKISTAPLNRYAYYLTPTGFSEKARLTAEYLRISFDLFRNARRQYNEIFEALAARGLTRIVLVGASELAEAALLSARETPVEVVGFVDTARAGEDYLGLPVAGSLAAFRGQFDAVAMCDVRDPQMNYIAALDEAAALQIDPRRVVGPAILRLRPPAPTEVAELAGGS
ncbi:MAG: winged helix-turn-helix transcriptional regulator [Rhodospirillales bacterium]|nr:winged helix-turn-helix transcriptional regulator [Rhodospirillales bacterium]